ncbi:MAG: hypothetical protein Q7O66_21545 [Dehalococcoidia bacterium]|nr:hypothetical protein [Dehalococcoidia bacterium]
MTFIAGITIGLLLGALGGATFAFCLAANAYGRGHRQGYHDCWYQMTTSRKLVAVEGGVGTDMPIIVEIGRN